MVCKGKPLPGNRWAVSNRMKRDLAIRALDMAVALRQPPKGCIYHTDSNTMVISYRQFDTNTIGPFDDWCRLAFWCGLTHTLIDLLRVFPLTCRLPGNALR
jgi:hypothetical protein